MKLIAFLCFVNFALAGATLMEILGRSAEALRPRHDEFRVGGVRPIIGGYLQQLHTELHALWDPLPQAIKTSAIKAATAPLGDTPNPLPGPYWRCIPLEVGFAMPAPAAPLSFASPCFSVNKASGLFSPDGSSYLLTLNASSPVNSTCSDSYLVATVDYLNIATLTPNSPSVTLVFPVNLNRKGSLLWHSRKGALVMRFLDDPLATLYSAVETVGLFIPSLITSPLTLAETTNNLDFISRYANVSMAPRPTATQVVTLDPSIFQSGDILYIMRIDGLATLEVWGTGAHTSHTVTFLRDDATGELWVVESQSNGADWPVDRVQKNLWEDWVKYAVDASYGYVWLPVAPHARALWNNTAAWEYFNSTEGINYGYQDFAVTFYDTLTDNLPWPASPNELEVVLGVIEGLLGWIQAENTPLINLLFTQTLVRRLGTDKIPFNSTFVEALGEGYDQDLSFAELMAKPENDTARYPQYSGPHAGKLTPSLVCNAYACALHKAAGTFNGVNVNCAETQNSDVYQLNIFDGAPNRPDACKAADPENPLCQLAGTHSITLQQAGTVAPYDWMDERCPSLPVAYARPLGC